MTRDDTTNSNGSPLRLDAELDQLRSLEPPPSLRVSLLAIPEATVERVRKPLLMKLLPAAALAGVLMAIGGYRLYEQMREQEFVLAFAQLSLDDEELFDDDLTFFEEAL